MKIVHDLRRIVQIVAATLREVFDEAAYDRFLMKRQVPRGKASYADFYNENQREKARRPRCC